MKKLLTHFELTTPYKFELNDLRAILSVINLWSIVARNETLIFICVLTAVFGIVNDIIFNRRINGLVIHFSTLAINIMALTRF